MPVAGQSPRGYGYGRADRTFATTRAKRSGDWRGLEVTRASTSEGRWATRCGTSVRNTRRWSQPNWRPGTSQARTSGRCIAWRAGSSNARLARRDSFRGGACPHAPRTGGIAVSSAFVGSGQWDEAADGDVPAARRRSWGGSSCERTPRPALADRLTPAPQATARVRAVPAFTDRLLLHG